MVTTPIIKSLESMIIIYGVVARITALTISVWNGILTANFVMRKINERMNLIPILMTKDQFEEFYLENHKRLKLVKWIIVCMILPLFIEVYL